MSVVENAPDRTPPEAARSVDDTRLLPILSVATLLLSALLLFLIQPMFAKMVLPKLGGAPSVWSVAMVFFQSLLLAGYAYAHLLMKLKRRVVPIAAPATTTSGRATYAGSQPQ
jgi:hypothetical protein